MTTDRTLAKRWPDVLVDRIAAKSFVLVLGAGVSMGCTNVKGEAPLSWTGLIEALIGEFVTGAPKKEARKMVQEGRFLEVAEVVRMQAKQRGREQDFFQVIATRTDGARTGPFRPTSLHDSILRLEPEIIVTTNYDKILERATGSGYNVHRYDSSSLGHDVRSGNPVLVKVHGSVDSPSDMVLTRSDYANLRRRGSDVLEVLEALFLTRTVLFMGYGFNDPDIHLILENILGARAGAASHYLLTGKDVPSHIREIYAFAYGTTVVNFATGDYGEMHRMVDLLADQVEAQRAVLADY